MERRHRVPQRRVERVGVVRRHRGPDRREENVDEHAAGFEWGGRAPPTESAGCSLNGRRVGCQNRSRRTSLVHSFASEGYRVRRLSATGIQSNPTTPSTVALGTLSLGGLELVILPPSQRREPNGCVWEARRFTFVSGRTELATVCDGPTGSENGAERCIRRSFLGGFISRSVPQPTSRRSAQYLGVIGKKEAANTAQSRLGDRDGQAVEARSVRVTERGAL